MQVTVFSPQHIVPWLFFKLLLGISVSFLPSVFLLLGTEEECGIGFSARKSLCSLERASTACVVSAVTKGV